MRTEKPPIDWTAVRADWADAALSIRKIAKRRGVSESAIRKRAAAEGWPERAAAQPKPAAKPQRQEEPEKSAPAPAPKIDATDPAQVAEAGQTMIVRMLDELDAVTTHAGQLEEMITAEVDDPRRRAAMMKAVSLGGRADTLKTLALAFKTWSAASGGAAQGKKAQRQAAAEGIGGRFAPRRGPRLAVNNE